VLAAAIAPLALTLVVAAVDVTARPADTRCPRPGALALALDGRVPEQADGWNVRYRVEARGAGTAENRVWLELRDVRGDLRLRRELAIADDGCDAAAEAIALIVGRFFREVSWTGAVPLPDMERKTEVEPPPAPVPAGPPWELEAGVALRREVSLTPGLALSVRLPVAERWRLAGGLVLQPPLTRNVEDGHVDLWSLPARVSVRRFVSGGPLTFDGGPLVTAGVHWSIPSGVTGDRRARVFLAAGGVCSARWALAARWSFALDFSAEVLLVAPTLHVVAVGMDVAPIWTPHRIQLAATAGIARAF
jgi:hypothetical protein